MPNMLTAEEWQLLLPALRRTFTRLTEDDLRDCAQRMDLTVAKVQNRHWLDRVSAQRQVLAVVNETLSAKAPAS